MEGLRFELPGPLERFCYWINEREAIRLKKEDGKPKPWTSNPILSAYRFCNVRRMDDKVSQWLYQNWYGPNYNHRNMVAAVGLARFINKPETLELIGFPIRRQPERIKQIVRKAQAEGLTVFNSAYMVRGNDGQDKIESVVDYYVEAIRKIPVDTSSMEETHARLLGCYGMGSFMAGQIVADLRWAMGASNSWKDREDWAPLGPGSKRGMNRVLGFPKDTPMNQKAFLERLTGLRYYVIERNLVPVSIYSRMEAHDWQNCLCEFDKYERVLHGEGRPKSRYPGA